MSEDLKKSTGEKTGKTGVKKIGNTGMEDVWDDIIVNALKYISRYTANKVADVAEIEMKEQINGVLRNAVERNVTNAIGDALVEVKKHFMGIAQ